MDDLVLSVSDFVSLLNQTLDVAYPSVVIEGEVSSFRVNKGMWVYFDLKDDGAKVGFFGSVRQLAQPIEDGMLVRVRGNPRHHPQYGFKVNVQYVTPSGEGNIKRAFELLKAKLEGEGLFDPERKRPLPRYPRRIGLITSSQAAAYEDFMRIINSRWGGLEILLADVQVQGEPAPAMIADAINHFNSLADPVDVLVLTRGGGSIEDLSAFSSEQVARAVAGSRTPTVVGVGHEVDVSLADLVADVRAATPTNAAQLVVPDRAEVAQTVEYLSHRLGSNLNRELQEAQAYLSRSAQRLSTFFRLPAQRVADRRHDLQAAMARHLATANQHAVQLERTLSNVDPRRVLQRGYSIVRLKDDQSVARSTKQIQPGSRLVLELGDGITEATADGTS